MMTATDRRRSPSPTRRAPRREREVVAAVRPVAESLALTHDVVVWDVSFRKVAGRETLRVALDRVGGVSSDDLARFSETMSRELDQGDVVPGDQRYVLEVTSPGAERSLETPEHFRICKGRVAKVVLRDGRTFEGEIRGTTERAVEIGSDDETVRAMYDDISKAQLVVKF
jgi:ribosome maturation factor RimP